MVGPVGNTLVAVGTAQPVQPCHLCCDFVCRRLTALRTTDPWTHRRHGSHGRYRRASSWGRKSRRNSETWKPSTLFLSISHTLLAPQLLSLPFIHCQVIHRHRSFWTSRTANRWQCISAGQKQFNALTVVEMYGVRKYFKIDLIISWNYYSAIAMIFGCRILVLW